MARNRSRAKREANPSAGMSKAVKKADKASEQSPKVIKGGSLSVRGTHFSSDNSMYDRGFGTIKRPAVEAIADDTGEIRSMATTGKVRNFNKNVGKAEKRGTAFIEATTAGKLFEGR